MRSITGADLLDLRGPHEVAYYADDRALVATVLSASRSAGEVIWDLITNVTVDGSCVVITVDGQPTAVRRFSYLVVREVA